MCTPIDSPIKNLFVRIYFYPIVCENLFLWESFLTFLICENLFLLWKFFWIFLICENLFLFAIICINLCFFLQKLLLSVRISSFLRGLFFFMITFFICASLCLSEDKKRHHLKQIQIFKKGCLYSVNGFKKLTHYFCALNASNFCWLWTS